ncbi:MAG: hypothetical protein QOH56_3478 [Pseudonocardiales bacterium]|nr:hypothetical protein [Pseudonocardiales bacterium]
MRNDGTGRGTTDSAIVDAARELFAEHGYRTTTMTDIGSAVGIRGPSLYKHIASKQELLATIMLGTMRALLRDQQAALAAGGDPGIRVRRMVEAHVRYHASHRQEAFVGNREIGSLTPENRTRVLTLRAEYEQTLRAVIEEGCRTQRFNVRSARLASYAILDMGMGVSAWFRADGENSVDEVSYVYADQALLLLGASD